MTSLSVLGAGPRLKGRELPGRPSQAEGDPGGPGRVASDAASIFEVLQVYPQCSHIRAHLHPLSMLFGCVLLGHSHSHLVEGGAVAKNLPTNIGGARDTGSIPGLGRSPREGHGNPLQYSCLENTHGQRSLTDYNP